MRVDAKPHVKFDVDSSAAEPETNCMGKTKGKKKTTRAPKRVRKAKPHVSPKKKPKRLNPKKKTRPKSRKPRKRNRRPARPQQKIKISGNSTKIKVDSRYAGRNVTILRKTTSFKPPVRLRRGAIGIRLLKNLILAPAVRHYHSIGKSEKNYFYVRLQYVFKRGKKKNVSHFSIGIARIKTEAQFIEYLIDVIESFLASLIGYSRDGFQDIRLTALIVQGYKK